MHWRIHGMTILNRKSCEHSQGTDRSIFQISDRILATLFFIILIAGGGGGGSLIHVTTQDGEVKLILTNRACSYTHNVHEHVVVCLLFSLCRD